MKINARNLHFKDLNEKVRSADGDVQITECFGQRYIGTAVSGKKISIDGTPGNALGAYLDGAVIEVNGSAQDATGDTMNDGKIIVHGNAGDALGYSMRGGSIFIKGNVGYRAGVLMKEYTGKIPVIVIGGKAGSFLGEYLAGGLIIVLDLDESNEEPVGNYAGTGMHGGKIFIRKKNELPRLPEQVSAEIAEDLSEIAPYIEEFAKYFGIDAKKYLKDKFYVLKPNVKNPYKLLYTKH